MLCREVAQRACIMEKQIFHLNCVSHGDLMSKTLFDRDKGNRLGEVVNVFEEISTALEP